MRLLDIVVTLVGTVLAFVEILLARKYLSSLVFSFFTIKMIFMQPPNHICHLFSVAKHNSILRKRKRSETFPWGGWYRKKNHLSGISVSTSSFYAVDKNQVTVSQVIVALVRSATPPSGPVERFKRRLYTQIASVSHFMVYHVSISMSRWERKLNWLKNSSS